jgi:hypothetical protein
VFRGTLRLSLALSRVGLRRRSDLQALAVAAIGADLQAVGRGVAFSEMIALQPL